MILAVATCAALAAPADALDPKPVSFLTPDGMRIAADYYAPPVADRGEAPIVILLHMYASDRKAWEPLLAPLHGAGFAILALDLRGHGESATTETRELVQKRDPAFFRKMQNDVLGAYDWLAAQDKLDRTRLALVGASVGASVAIQYAAHDRSVDAVVALSPGLRYMELNSDGDMRQITGRKLLLLATEDERDAPYTLEKRTTGVTVKIYHDAKAHGTDLLGKVVGVEDDIVSFLKSAVGGPSTHTVCGSIERAIYHEPDSEWVQRIARSNLRYYSSPDEAEARGLRAARSKKSGQSGQVGGQPGDVPAPPPDAGTKPQPGRAPRRTRGRG